MPLAHLPKTSHAVQWLLHLLAPLLVAVGIEMWGVLAAQNPGSSSPTLDSIAAAYAMLAAPMWIWSAVSSVFNLSDRILLGGLLGANLLLASVTVLVAFSAAPHSGNGWFIYFLASPIAIALGALSTRVNRKRKIAV